MNAKRDPNVYLCDIRAAIRLIRRYTEAGEDRFLSDTMVQDAVIRQISVIGEAAAKLPRDLRDKRPNVPWKKVTGMRNILIHDYAETDIPTVWTTVTEDLPRLQHAVERMIAQIEDSENARNAA